MSLYQRPIDAVLLFPSGDVVLLTPREADAFLEAAWSPPPGAAPRRGAATLVSLSYARMDDPQAAARLSVCIGGGGGASKPALHPATVARLQLLGGATVFGAERRAGAVAELLPEAAARCAALQLPSFRGNAHLVARSQLERVCEAEGQLM